MHSDLGLAEGYSSHSTSSPVLLEATEGSLPKASGADGGDNCALYSRGFTTADGDNQWRSSVEVGKGCPGRALGTATEYPPS